MYLEREGEREREEEEEEEKGYTMRGGSFVFLLDFNSQLMCATQILKSKQAN